MLVRITLIIMAIGEIIWLVIIWVISAIPLNIAVKMIGGHSSIIKVIIANLIVGMVAAYLNNMFGFIAVILSFIVMLFIYKLIFKIGWIRAILAWFLQFVIIAIFFIVLLLLGVSLLVF